MYRKARLLPPLTRTVLPFDAHDFLLNLICNISFCLLFYWFSQKSLFLLLIQPWWSILTHHICLKCAQILIGQDPLPKLLLNLFELEMGSTVFHLHLPQVIWSPAYAQLRIWLYSSEHHAGTQRLNPFPTFFLSWPCFYQNISTCECCIFSHLHPAHSLTGIKQHKIIDWLDFSINCHCISVWYFAGIFSGINNIVEWLLWRFMCGSREVCFLSIFFPLK